MTEQAQRRAAQPERGIVYLAIGDRFVREAAVSARSVRRHTGLPATIFTDHPEQARLSQAFDDVVAVRRTSPGRAVDRDKLLAILATPYEQTLFLDTDTYVGGSLDDCWQLLDRFDLAAAGDRRFTDDFPGGTGVPAAFKEINMGVVFFRRSPQFVQMIEESLRIYDRIAGELAGVDRFWTMVNDQSVTRLALYRSAVRAAPLTEEFNCRFASYGKLNGRVVVLHGRLQRAPQTAANLERVLDRLNAVTAPRVFAAGRLWSLRPRRIPLLHTFDADRARGYEVVDLREVAAGARRRLLRLSAGAGPQQD